LSLIARNSRTFSDVTRRLVMRLQQLLWCMHSSQFTSLCHTITALKEVTPPKALWGRRITWSLFYLTTTACHFLSLLSLMCGRLGICST
jgi:hypothetical protein